MSQSSDSLQNPGPEVESRSLGKMEEPLEKMTPYECTSRESPSIKDEFAPQDHSPLMEMDGSQRKSPSRKTEPEKNRVMKKKSPSPATNGVGIKKRSPSPPLGDPDFKDSKPNLWDDIRAGNRRITRSAKLTTTQLSPASPYLSCKSDTGLK